MDKYRLVLYTLLFPVLLFSQEVDFSNFKGVPVKASFIKEISDEKMFLYVGDEYTEAKKDIELNVFINLLDLSQDVFFPIYRYSSSGVQKVSVLKYKVLVDGKPEKVLTDLFIKTDEDKWELIADETKSKNIFYHVLSKVSLAFYKKMKSFKSDFDYKDIKDSTNNVINIKKLALALENNPR